MGLISSPKSLALDTNIFITAYDEENTHNTKCVELLSEITTTNPQVFISVLVFEEFLVQIYRGRLDITFLKGLTLIKLMMRN